ncbi:MAG: hypothetical protein GY854_06820 [Deltaproteobacteria bacterium]|nr:hypothetical protein [Deltaproteobacteria bacterium]
MMFKLSMSASKVILVALMLNLALCPEPARAQEGDPSQTAVGLLRDAMDAYGNLDFDSCKSLLDQATQMVPQLDKKTAARVYVTYGILHAGGYADNAAGEQSFKVALCLDSKAALNPMFSTPEIDLLFNMAKQQAQPDVCPSILTGIQTGGPEEVDVTDIIDIPESTITPCGDHDPITEQKQKHELPFFLTLAPEMRGQVNKVVVRYAFDSAERYTEVVLPPRGAGYGAMLTCDQGQIRVYDPATVSYYIEGLDNTGQVVCGHGTVDAPLEILMMSDSAALPSIAGMQPKECAPCPPWDEKCGTGSIVSQLGDPCTPDIGCGEGMICGDLGICEMGDEEESQANRGPEHFYANLTGGVGFGYLKKNIDIRRINAETDPESEWGYTGVPRGAIEDTTSKTKGWAFGGIPVRLAIGFYVTPNLSLEVSGRFDVYVTSTNEPKSCWEAGGGSDELVREFYSQPDTEDSCAIDGLQNMDETRRKDVSTKAVVQDAFGNDIMTQTFQYAWLINARVRYRFIHKGVFSFSAFGGIGYGHFQYRIAQKPTAYFPMPGMFDIELGPGIAFYFNKHFGIVVDVPIDIIVGDGFGFNIDVTAGLSFGF